MIEDKLKKEYFIIMSVTYGIGIFFSSFIMGFILRVRAKGKKLNTCYLILVALGISGTWYQSTALGFRYATMILSPVYRSAQVSQVLSQLTAWSGSCNSWLIACLCVFYCVKIVDFSNRIFFFLKPRISKVVPWLLLGTVVGSFILSMSLCLSSGGEHPQNSTTNLTANSSSASEDKKAKELYPKYFGVLGFILPVLLDIASTALIFVSLCRHTRRMKENASGFSQPRLEAHFAAARMMGSLLLTCSLLVLAQYAVLHFKSSNCQFIFGVIIDFCTSAQPIILVLGNTKLKQAFWKVVNPWKKLVCCQ
ncbi:taste receptor type 2 member 2-like [Lissotriton helveticus]